MLIEELFRRGIMVMGPSPKQPSIQAGIFNASLLAGFPAERLSKIREMTWLVGEWATSLNPAYSEPGSARVRLCEKDTWLSRVGVDGRERPFITFDPFSKQWMYVLAEGAYCILRSPGWTANRIVFEGRMTMIGVDCELRQTWTKVSDDEYIFINEEQLERWVMELRR
jgi:hypothetical protein